MMLSWWFLRERWELTMCRWCCKRMFYQRSDIDLNNQINVSLLDRKKESKDIYHTNIVWSAVKLMDYFFVMKGTMIWQEDLAIFFLFRLFISFSRGKLPFFKLKITHSNYTKIGKHQEVPITIEQLILNNQRSSLSSISLFAMKAQTLVAPV